MDHFWCALSKDVGRIPETLKNILEVTEYINAGLAFIGNEEIASIENDIRQLPEIMNLPPNDPTLAKYFGRFSHNPGRFRLMAGERAVLKMIASCIHRKGLAHYLKTVERREREVAPTNIEQHAHDVRRRIIDFFNDRCDGSAEQIEFCNRISTINVEISESEDGSLLARIRCIFCTNDNDITCRPERMGGNWKVSNFLAHIRNVHKTLNAPASNARGLNSSGCSKPSPNDVSASESGSNGYGSYEYWANSSDVNSSHENFFKQRTPNSSGPTTENMSYVVKEEFFSPEQ